MIVYVLVLIFVLGNAHLHIQASAPSNCISPLTPAVPGTPVPPPTTVGIIVINEVLLSPHQTWNGTAPDDPQKNIWLLIYMLFMLT